MKFVCPKCNHASKSSEWNKELDHQLGGTQHPVESYMKNHCVYICPSCGEVVHGRNIVDVYGMK